MEEVLGSRCAGKGRERKGRGFGENWRETVREYEKGRMGEDERCGNEIMWSDTRQQRK